MARIEKVNQQVKREVGYIILRELKDPRLSFVTITNAEVSKDLQHAKVYFSVLGDTKQLEEATEALDKARGMIRRLLGQRLEIRYTPEIEFFFDKSVEYSARIDQALEEIRHEFGENP